MVVRNVLQNEKSFAFCKSLITLDVTLNATAVTAGQQPWARHKSRGAKIRGENASHVYKTFLNWAMINGEKNFFPRNILRLLAVVHYFFHFLPTICMFYFYCFQKNVTRYVTLLYYFHGLTYSIFHQMHYFEVFNNFCTKCHQIQLFPIIRFKGKLMT